MKDILYPLIILFVLKTVKQEKIIEINFYKNVTYNDDSDFSELIL